MASLSRPYPLNFLKAVFNKIYLVHSWILCPKWGYSNFSASVEFLSLISVDYNYHCVKRVRIRSYSGPNAGKYHAVYTAILTEIHYKTCHAVTHLFFISLVTSVSFDIICSLKIVYSSWSKNIFWLEF